MTDAVLRLTGQGAGLMKGLWSDQCVWLVTAAILALVWILELGRTLRSET